MKLLFAALLIALSAPIAARAAETDLQFSLTLPGNAEQRVVKYQCEGEEDLRTVTYLNAKPNFLAILNLDGEPVIFASVISGSGAAYASGQFQWATKGPEASLFDLLQGADAPAIATCLEANDIP